MYISTHGWDGLVIAVVLLAILIVGFVLGARWARKRGSIAKRKQIEADMAEVRGWRNSVERQAIEQDKRQRVLDRRDGDHDDRERELYGREAELDQREAALELRERALAGPILIDASGVTVGVA